MKILDLTSPRFHKKERHGNEKKGERKEKKMDKRKSKIKRTQRSLKKMGSKSPREKERKIQNQKIAMTSRKETYGEERKIKNIRGVFLPQKP